MSLHSTYTCVQTTPGTENTTLQTIPPRLWPSRISYVQFGRQVRTFERNILPLSAGHSSGTCLSNYTEDHDLNTVVRTTDLKVTFYIHDVRSQSKEKLYV
jgi:hypothetical protein